MRIADVSVNRPVAMSCLILGLTLLGINSYRKMGLEELPRIDAPFITVTTVYPGASPEQLETDVAKRIEDKMMTLEGLKHVSSTCMENSCQTILQFHLETDVDIAATDVREKIDLIRAELPEDAEDPKVLKYDINAKPVIRLALTGNAPVDALYDYADNRLRDRITVIPGVADVALVGGAKREVRVLLDRDRLVGRGLTSSDVARAIETSVRKIPAGRLRDRGREFTVTFDADYGSVADLAGLEIVNHQGRRVYLKDVGRVEMGTAEVRQVAEVGGRPCIAVKVIKRSDANTVSVVRRVKRAMDDLNRNLPGGMELVWVSDDGRFIEATLQTAWMNVGLGILLTAAVLFLFLFNVRSMLVVGITMPLNIIIGLFFMQQIGYTINISTLIAIGMSVGILVTDSIVVLEAIVKHLEESGDPKDAARRGTAECTVEVLAGAGTNMVVLFPIGIMGGMVGLFLQPLAITMLIMTAVSLFVSFTLVPLLASLLLKPHDVETSRPASVLARVEQRFNQGLQRFIRRYQDLLRFLAKRRRVAWGILLLVLLLLVASLGLVPGIGGAFFPDMDRGELTVKLEFPTGYSLDRTLERLAEAQDLLRDLPELKQVLSTAGKVEGIFGKVSEGVYLADVYLKFSERDERDVRLENLIALTRERLSNFPDCIVTVSVTSPMGGTEAHIMLEISGEDLGVLDDLALRAQKIGEGIPGVLDPDTTVRQGKPKLRVTPRRSVLGDMHIPALAVGSALRGNLEGLNAGTFSQGDRNFDIVVKMEEKSGKEQVERFMFPAGPGLAVPLTNVAQVQEQITPIQILRKDKHRISMMSANVSSSLPLGKAVDLLTNRMDASGMPPGYTYGFSGMVEDMDEAMAALAEAGVIALLLVLLTLAAIMESFRQPLFILVTVPLALIGVVWSLFLTGQCFSIFVVMGVVMLTGIVVNNAILIVDRMNVLRETGVPPELAMIRSAGERFRPVAMITMAAVLGMLPMAFSGGIGAELRNDVGVASAGGILASGVLSIFVLPILYNLLSGKKRPQNSPDIG